MKPGEKHGWQVRANLPKNSVCFRKLCFWHWGSFEPLGADQTTIQGRASATGQSIGGTLFSMGECLPGRGHTELPEDSTPSPQDSGWASYPKLPGSLCEICLLNKNNLVTSQLRTKVQKWKQPSHLACTHDHILAFLGDGELLFNNPKGLGTVRDMSSLKASKVVTSSFCISSSSVFCVTDDQWKRASGNEKNHGRKVSWSNQRSNVKVIKGLM